MTPDAMTAGLWLYTSPCQCCQSTVGRPPAPAAYRWTGPHGNVTLLCASCCAIWRENARDDPSLAPQQIERARSIP